MSIRDAVNALGYDDDDDAWCCLVSCDDDGVPRKHHTLRKVGNWHVDAFEDLFLASGRFVPGRVTVDAGRTQGNLRDVRDVPLDFDLAPWLGPDVAKAALYAMDEITLDQHITSLGQEVAQTLADHGIPWRRMHCTGYGVQVLVGIAPDDRTRIDDARAVHRFLVETINTAYKSEFADARVSDAGTRIFRLPDTPNTKRRSVFPGLPDRACYTMVEQDGVLCLDDWLPKIGVTEREKPVPLAGDRLLSPDAFNRVVNALQPRWNDYEGSRHDLAMALSGLLSKDDVAEDQIAEIVATVAQDDEELDDRLNVVRSTARRTRNGEEVVGYSRMKVLLSPPVLKEIEAAIAPRVGITLLPRREPEIIKQEGHPFPEQALRGWFGEYVAEMRQCTQACPGFHLGVAFTVVGMYFGRAIYIEHFGKHFPNFYTVLVGATGDAKKDTTMNLGINMLTETMLPNPFGGIPTPFPAGFAVMEGVSTGEGIIDELAKNPNQLIYSGEFSAILTKGRNSDTLFPTLQRLFDCHSKIDNPRAGKAAVSVSLPFVGMMGGIPPETLARMMSGDDAASGFANRILWVFSPGNEVHMKRGKVPDQAVTRDLLRRLESLKTECGRREIGRDRDAEDAYDAWDDRREQTKPKSERGRQLVAREAALVFKIAMLYAVTDRRWVISGDDFEAAAAFVGWCRAHLLQAATLWGASTDVEIQALLMAYVRKEPMLRPHLVLLVGQFHGTVAVTRVLDSLISNGILAMDKTGAISSLVKDDDVA